MTRRKSQREMRYIDPVAVERTIKGDRPAMLTIHERRHIVDLLTQRGEPAWRIAELLGTTQRSIQRHRLALRSAK